MEAINKHKKLIPFLFILILSIILCFSYFSSELYVGHDTFFHMHRIVGSLEALQDHQFLPKIYPYTNNGYGYASPLFYCDLFIYPFAILYYLGIPLVVCYKMMLAFYSIVTVIVTFVVASKVSKKNSLLPYFATILYCFCNYRLYDVYVRSSFGEIFAFIFIPIIFYATYKLVILKEDAFMPLGIGFALLAMSHNISFALYCFLFGIFMIFHYLYTFFFDKDNIHELKKLTISILKAVGIALLLSAWYLIPMLEQFIDQEFLVNQVSLMYDLGERVLPITAVLNPFAIIDEPRYFIDQLINIGSILLFMPLIYVFIYRKAKNRYITFLMITAYLLLLMIIGIIPIYKLELLTFMQFLFRLYILIYPILAVVCIYIFVQLENMNKNKLCKIILIITIIYSVFNCTLLQIETMQSDKQIVNNDTRERLYDYSSQISQRDHNGLEISAGEYLPTTEIVDYLEETTFIKEITDDGYLDIIYDFDRQFTEIGFTYDNPDEKKMVMLPQTYYKGYQAYELIDGKEVPIETINNPTYKKVSFYVDGGMHTYVCRYEGTLVQNITLIISATTFVLIVAYYIYQEYRNRKVARI